MSIRQRASSPPKTTSQAAAAKQSDVPVFVVPDLSVKDLLSSIPQHCFKRSAIRSGSYVVWDFVLLTGIYKATTFVEPILKTIDYPHPALYSLAKLGLWSVYGFAAGLVATGLWVIAHECGHQAFSESKAINNTVGWVLHSALGVPYHSWRISHAKHHASTGHMTQDQVFVPKTRKEFGLPAFDPSNGDDLLGLNVSAEVQKELLEAIGDSPIHGAFWAAMQLLLGWPLYLIRNASGQRHYPRFTNHFVPKAPLYAPHHHLQVIVSDIGIALWLGALSYWTYTRGFGEVMRIYGVPYLWVNSWLVLITFLQHTDPLVPHYRAPEFTFPRGALSTVDRALLGGAPWWVGGGKFWGMIGAATTHGISETHVLHHVSSKIPHYNAWEASDALRARLASTGLQLQAAPGGWGEVIRVFRECKFVEDEGNVLFYKNARGVAALRPVFSKDGSGGISDSGVDLQ